MKNIKRALSLLLVLVLVCSLLPISALAEGEAPVITKDLKNYETVAQNSTLSLSILATDAEAYKWESSTDNSTWTEIINAASSTYLPNTSTAGTAYYKATATNIYGSATSKVVTVTVLPADSNISAIFSFSSGSEPITCKVGDNYALSASGSGPGTWRYTWYQDDTRLANANKSATTCYVDTRVTGTYTLYCIASLDGDNRYYFESDHIDVQVNAADAIPNNTYAIATPEGESPAKIHISGVTVESAALEKYDGDSLECSYNIQLDAATPDNAEFMLYFECAEDLVSYTYSRGNLPVISSYGIPVEDGKPDANKAAVASFRKLNITLTGGSAQNTIYVYDTGNDYSKNTRLKYTLNFTNKPAAASILKDAVQLTGQWMMKADLFGKDKSANLVVPFGETTTQVTITTDIGAQIKVNDGEAQNVGEDGTYTVTLNSSTEGTANTITLAKNGERTYTITCFTQKYAGMPDNVADYLCIGSQYTNGKGLSDYGLRGVATLLGSNEDAISDSTSGPASLGNFGGYITYYYEDAVTDDPNNPYGIDFITFGNSVEGSNEFAEPGQVWVSEDGNTWYALAGALHYDNCAVWDYSITYTPASDCIHSSWTDSLGRSEVQPYYEYPVASYYPLHTFAADDESSMTFNGIFLKADSGTNEFGNTRPPFPDFGYTDVGQKLTMLPSENAEDWTAKEQAAKFARNIAGNPYQGSYQKDGRTFLPTTDGMDLAWAVDADGQPVTLPNGIHYVKIVTANNIENGAIGEKSTEVNMVRTAAANDSAVGATAEPAGITVDGKALALTSSQYVYNDVVVDGPFEVAVDAPEDVNVYINSVRGHSTGFNTMPDHKILRIIVQEGEKEPVIYYLNLVETTDTPELYATLTLDPNGGTVDGATTIKFDAHMAGFTLPTPTISDQNLEFAGWYFGQNLYTTYPSEIKDITLTARWNTVSTPALTNAINVSFRLIGCTLADLKDKFDTIDLSDGDYKEAKYVTWIATTNYTMHEGDTVCDLFVKALNSAGLQNIGASAGYVRTVYAPSAYGGYALSEFTNGKNSGWMYTINGSHPLYGLTEQKLSNGDAVVWHYVNDYAWEVEDWAALGGSGWPQLGTENHNYWNKWLEAADTNPISSGSSNGPGGSGGTGSPSGTTATAASLAPKVTASGGAAKVTLDVSDLSGTIKSARDNGDKSIVIAPEITGTATKVSVDLPKTSLSSIASDTDAGLTVQTPVGNVTLPNSALSSIASQASGSSVTVSLDTVDTTTLTSDQQKAVGSGTVYDISVLSGNSKITSFGGGNITVSLPYTLKSGEYPSNVTVWYLNGAGQLQQMTATYDKTTGLATFTTPHLSYYVVGYMTAWTNPFSDVKSTDWFYSAVKYAVQKGLFNGTLASIFTPNGNMTRAMLVTVLYRLEGKPAVTGTNSFTDIQSGQWYTDAVTWASANKIVSGYGSGLFGTNDNITREQMTTILYRYAKYKGYDVTKTSDLKAYTDASDISNWAATAIKWAVADGLVTGTTSTTLSPYDSATRAQVATILMRFIENVVKFRRGLTSAVTAGSL